MAIVLGGGALASDGWSGVADGGPYRIREEEIPREGLKVTREIHRTRGSDGSTHVWISRRKQIGRGEGSSGLRFDVATVRS